MVKSLSSPFTSWIFVLVVGLAGCSVGESGVSPPFDKIFLPSGLTTDPASDYLYVVNSNSDLRYNAGTLVPIDMAKALGRLAPPTASDPIPSCSKTRFSRTESVSDSFCCWDLVDSNILNCNETQFVHSDSTIQIGSFGGQVEIQQFQMAGLMKRRLFILVRAEPSVTYADVTFKNELPSIQCAGERGQAPTEQHLYCDDRWRIRRSATAKTGAFELTEEPHVLAMDTQLGALFVGHLTVSVNSRIEGGGVSTLDICHPESSRSPRYAGQARTVFPDQYSQAVIGLSRPNAEGTIKVYATARYSAEISGLVLRSPTIPCDSQQPGEPAEDRDLSLIPSDYFLSSAFLPAGADIRGILFDEEQTVAYVLHRNAPESISNPSALVAIDRRWQADGTRSNRPIDILKMCNGPTGMQFYPKTGAQKRIYVTCYDEGQIYVVDPFVWQVEAVIDVGTAPNNLVFPATRKNLAYVASFAGNHLAVIDLDPQSPMRNRVVQRIGLPHGNSE